MARRALAGICFLLIQAEIICRGSLIQCIRFAGIAQLAEQLLRKQLVGGSSPLSGTIHRYK